MTEKLSWLLVKLILTIALIFCSFQPLNFYSNNYDLLEIRPTANDLHNR
jgi:hypothetical protein